MPPPIIVVDTNVLLDLADDNETVIDCFATIRKKLPKSQIVVVPTVVAELVHLTKDRDDAETAHLALTSLKKLLSWGFNPLNFIPAGHGIIEETARKIRVAGLIPEEELHDSLIVVEAGLSAKPNVTVILLSNDGDLNEIDRPRLKKLLNDDCDMNCPIIASPKKIVHDFFNAAH